MMEPEDVYGEQEYFEVAFSFAKGVHGASSALDHPRP
jgi:hypothetical protein